MKYNKPFVICVIATILFCIVAALNIIPYLRGPAPYPPEWQWPYFFVNTLHKIYLPILVSILLIGLYVWEEKKNIFLTKKLWIFIIFVMLLSFAFQLSMLFFSRSGISVLVHRIINPELNGYFTASLTIQNVAEFLRFYNDIMLQFVYHAKSHPPGAILVFYVLKLLIAPFTFFIDFANSLTPAHSDVRQLWNTLMPVEKATALFSAFFIPLLSTVSLFPLYYSAKILYGTRVALRSIFLFFFIPTIVFFIPINDSFLHIFSLSAFYLLLLGLSKKHLFPVFVSGAILFFGVFFNLSLLPMLILLFVFAFLYLRNKNALFADYVKGGTAFTIGFFLPGILLYLLFRFNFIEVFYTIITYAGGNMARSYQLWIYYNLQDFFIFCGIPLTIIFFLQTEYSFMQIIKKQFKKIDPLFSAFFIMIVVLNFSGMVMGEVGRLWSPFIPFMVLVTVAFMTNKLIFSHTLFAGILVLQVIQLLVMQEFWVMLW